MNLVSGSLACRGHEKRGATGVRGEKRGGRDVRGKNYRPVCLCFKLYDVSFVFPCL